MSYQTIKRSYAKKFERKRCTSKRATDHIATPHILTTILLTHPYSTPLPSARDTTTNFA